MFGRQVPRQVIAVAHSDSVGVVKPLSLLFRHVLAHVGQTIGPPWSTLVSLPRSLLPISQRTDQVLHVLASLLACSSQILLKGAPGFAQVVCLRPALLPGQQQIIIAHLVVVRC